MSTAARTVLVINAGSSSLKFSLFETGSGKQPCVGAHGQVQDIGAAARLQVRGADGRELLNQALAHNDHGGAVAAIVQWLQHAPERGSLTAVGHRLVHGGERFAQPVLVDPQVMRELAALIPLAPLHQPHELDAIRAFGAAVPGVAQVACFDTAFHAAQASVERQYALPRALSADGIRRYGFHGLSYEYIVSALPRIAPSITRGRVVVAHLGNGASMCAVADGRSVACTMGFTPVDGLPMGTRTGALDPGVILYLMQHRHMSAASIERLIYEQSGLLGVSGISSDMRVLLASDRPEAQEAVDLFVYRIGRELGSLVAALGGLDALIFTGGIGENAATIRARVCQQAAWLGIRLDRDANDRATPCISMRGSAPSAWVIATDENLMVARHVCTVLKL